MTNLAPSSQYPPSNLLFPVYLSPVEKHRLSSEQTLESSNTGALAKVLTWTDHYDHNQKLDNGVYSNMCMCYGQFKPSLLFFHAWTCKLPMSWLTSIPYHGHHKQHPSP